MDTYLTGGRNREMKESPSITSTAMQGQPSMQNGEPMAYNDKGGENRLEHYTNT